MGDKHGFLCSLGCLLLVACGSDDPAGRGGQGAAGGSPSNSSSGAAGGSEVGGAGAGGASRGPNRIVVVDQFDTPLARFQWLVNDADGSVDSMGMTDEAGEAYVHVPDGGTVSALGTVETYLYVQAVVAPPPDAVVRFVMYQTPRVITPPAPTEYSVFTNGYPAATTSLTFVSSCDSLFASGVGPGGYKADLNNEYCLEEPNQDFLVVAKASGNPIAWATAFDVATNPGGAMEVAVYPNQTSFVQVDASLTNIPSTATRADIDFNAEPDALHERADLTEIPPSSTTMAAVFKVADLPGGWVAVDRVEIDSAVGYSEIRRNTHYATLPASHTFAADTLAFVSPNALDASDPIHPTATWSATSNARGDAGFVYLSWSSATSGVNYFVTLPPDAITSYRVPEFPPELNSFAPAATSDFGSVYAGYSDYETADGYEAALGMTAKARGGNAVTTTGAYY